jgi:CubicO group peptidase (beta-lactamase class C family)
MTALADVPVSGTVAPGFEPVLEAFRENFSLPGGLADIGAGLTVFQHGEPVVDLVGGYRDEARTAKWTPDTVANIWSSTKGVTALAFARLVDRGLVGYDDRVTLHWPEFAVAGKEATTVGQLISHQGGLNGFRLPTTVEQFGDWPLVTGRLAEQAPYWVPGEDTSYHAMTFGFLIGELARRITGLEPRALIETEVAAPLDADIQIGLRPDDLARVADLVPFDDAGTPPAPDPLAAPAMTNPVVRQDWANRASWRAAQVPAANGHATAHGLAKLYGAVASGDSFDGAPYLTRATIDSVRKPRSTRPDRFLGERTWGAGVSLNMGGAWGPDPATFGHTGWGGSFGCANLARGIGIGYVMNRMGGQIALDPRAVRLCNAVFACTG